MSEDSTHHEGHPGGPDTLPAYTPAQWFADWQAFQGARLDTAEEQRDWILLHFAGKYPVAEENGRMQRLMKALLWVRENQREVCKLTPWTPGTQMPELLIHALYLMFGCPLMDAAPPATVGDLPEIFEMIRRDLP